MKSVNPTILFSHLSQVFNPQHVITVLSTYRYGLVLPIAIIEGPIISIISGFLVKLGYFSFWPAYITLVCGDLVGDFIWYMIGRHGASRLIARYGYLVSLHPENMEKIEHLFKKHETKTLLISKMTNGFGFALIILTTAGTLRVPLKKYMAINAIGGLFWSALLLTVGYFLGHLYNYFDKGLQVAFFMLVAVIFVGIVYGFRRYTKLNTLIDRI